MDGVTATTAEINHLDGVTGNIQTQIDSKYNKMQVRLKPLRLHKQ